MTFPQKFFVAGISFKKTDVGHRSKFTFTSAQCAQIYKTTQADCFQHYFILSTCNRTEIYGFAPCEYVLLSLLQHHANASPEEVQRCAYIKEESEAVNHFFSVASGMDSQIPGDYEIIAQIKTAFQLAKDHQRTNGYIEKLYNFALQASKEVKAHTSFSNGTVSVIYTAAQRVIQQKDIKKVVVLGAGTTGQQAIQYLLKLQPGIQVVLINRDQAKATEVADSFRIEAALMENLTAELRTADALIVTTNADQPLINEVHLINSTVKYIFDLAVPQNVAPAVYKMRHLAVYNVDAISKWTNATLQSRLSEVPKVKMIVGDYQKRFTAWSARHHYFTVASQASVAGNILSHKELTQLFNQWHESLKSDSSLEPYSTKAHLAIESILKSTYPAVQLAKEGLNPFHHEACHSHSHTQQPSCFMANRCSCQEVKATR